MDIYDKIILIPLINLMGILERDFPLHIYVISMRLTLYFNKPPPLLTSGCGLPQTSPHDMIHCSLFLVMPLQILPFDSLILNKQ